VGGAGISQIELKIGLPRLESPPKIFAQSSSFVHEKKNEIQEG
jgi:hypothetical protein